MDNPSKYCVLLTDTFRSFCWGNQCAVYHTESGDTHLLNKIDLEVLQFVNATPLSVNDLAVEFKSILGDGADQYLQVLLSHLSGLGLIETIHSKAAH